MKVGIIGLPQSGKTTIFNALTNLQMDVKGYAQKNIESHMGTVKVPDGRVDYLASVYKPKKISFVDMTFIDIGCKKNDDGRSEFDMTVLRGLDMLAVVVRAFVSDSVVHPMGDPDPLRDVQYLKSEFILEDLSLVENRMARLEKDVKRKLKEAVKEMEYLTAFQKHLEAEQPLSTYPFDDDAHKLFRGFQFLSQKPIMVALNTGEDETDTVDYKSAVDNLADSDGAYITLCGKLEMEIAQLPDEDKTLFLEELNIPEPALDRFIRMSYKLLNRIVFFTVGPDEVKAWEIRKGTCAKDAGGKIHTDIARGFIRAEVLAYDDFVDCENSYQVARSRGLVRLEGKQYPVRDGDIIEFRFNV